MSGTRTHQERIDNSEHMDIDSGDESDGKSALRQVEAREEPKAAQRGPGNASMQHFHDPTATAQEVVRFYTARASAISESQLEYKVLY